MASVLSLSGAHSISAVDRLVAAGSLGAYILSRDGRAADYVGRSDYDLRERIKASAQEGHGYRYFWFQYSTSAMDGYRLECLLYHEYRPADNSIHPAVPQGSNWRCPVTGCPWS